MGIDFDQLAQETLALSETMSFPPQKDVKEEAAASGPQGPGVVFYFDGGISTYCLRGMASEDLEWEQELLQRRDPAFLRTFRLREDWQGENFIFYPTESTIDAEIIADHILGKRFPKEEAVLCNLSDPGFSWWMDDSDPHGQRLEIFYQSHTIERDRDLIQLGPLGDPMLAAKRFAMSLPYLKSIFAVNEFSSTDKSFVISCNRPGDEGFKNFKRVFLHGDYQLQKDFAAMDPMAKSYYLFVREVALLRRFWLFVQELL